MNIKHAVYSHVKKDNLTMQIHNTSTYMVAATVGKTVLFIDEVEATVCLLEHSTTLKRLSANGPHSNGAVARVGLAAKRKRVHRAVHIVVADGWQPPLEATRLHV